MRKISAETQQSGHVPRSGPEIKDGAQRGLDAGQSRGELDPAVDECTQRIAAASWWCNSCPSTEDVVRNGKTNSLKESDRPVAP